MKKLVSIFSLCVVLLLVSQGIHSVAEASNKSPNSEMGSYSRTQPDIPSVD